MDDLSELDLAVAKAIDIPTRWEFDAPIDGSMGRLFYNFNNEQYKNKQFSPSTNWSQGGPLIEEYGISLFNCEDMGRTGNKKWSAATSAFTCEQSGPTPLIAAMRALVESKK